MEVYEVHVKVSLNLDSFRHTTTLWHTFILIEVRFNSENCEMSNLWDCHIFCRRSEF